MKKTVLAKCCLGMRLIEYCRSHGVETFQQFMTSTIDWVWDETRPRDRKLLSALKRNCGNCSAAARELGISRSAVYGRIGRRGLQATVKTFRK